MRLRYPVSVWGQRCLVSCVFCALFFMFVLAIFVFFHQVAYMGGFFAVFADEPKKQIQLRPEDSILRVAPKYKGMGADQFEKALVFVILKTWSPVQDRTFDVHGRWFEIRLALEAGLNVYYCVHERPSGFDVTTAVGDRITPEKEVRLSVYDNHGNWVNEFILCYRTADQYYFSTEGLKSLRYVRQGIMQNLGSIIPLAAGRDVGFTEVFPDYNPSGEDVPASLSYRGRQYIRKGDIWMTPEGDPLAKPMQRELNRFYESYLQSLQGSAEELRLSIK